MDGHKLRSIHGSRCFFTKDNTIDKITGQLQATCPTWKAWLARANAFKNVDPCRSYASVLQQRTFPTVHKYLEIVDNGPALKPFKRSQKIPCKANLLLPRTVATYLRLQNIGFQSHV